MPRVPVYERRVSSQPLPMVKAPAPVASGVEELAAGLGKVANVAAGIADKEIRRAEDTQINDFEVGLSEAESKIRNQLGSLKGEAAFLPQIGPDGTPTGPTPAEAAKAHLESVRAELLQRLVPSSRAKGVALERSKRRVAGAHEAIDSHVAAQHEVAFRASDEAARQMREDRMGRDALIESERNGILMDSDLRAAALARSPEEAQAMQAEARQRLHGIALDRMLDPVVGNQAEAARYFEEVKGELGTKTSFYESRVQTVKTEASDTEAAAAAIHATRWPLDSTDPKRAVDEEYGTPWLNQQRVLEAVQSEEITPGAKQKMLKAAAISAKGQAEERAAYFGKVNLDRVTNGGVIVPGAEWDYVKLHDREGAAKLLAASDAARAALLRATRARAGGNKREIRAIEEAQKAANKQALDEFRGMAPSEQAALDTDAKLAAWATEQGLSVDGAGISALKPERRQGMGQFDLEDDTKSGEFVDAYTARVPGFARMKPAVQKAHAADARRLYVKNGGKELPVKDFDGIITSQFPVKPSSTRTTPGEVWTGFATHLPGPYLLSLGVDALSDPADAPPSRPAAPAAVEVPAAFAAKARATPGLENAGDAEIEQLYRKRKGSR